jgi:CheY-like chemotaxis protein
MKKILLVEDNNINADMLKRRFENKGFKVWIDSEAEEAIKTVSKFQPDIILMDMDLPGMDGWECTKQLKKNPETMHIPIIATTAFAIIGEREKALLAGCDEYESKPINFEQLLNKINKLI